MPLSDWENKAVELMTEVSILGRLIATRINTDMPFGLNEIRLGILMVVERKMPMGMTRASLEWTLDDNVTDIGKEIDYSLSEGLIMAQPNQTDTTDPVLFLTEEGKKRLGLAIQALMPKFAPGLESVTADDMVSACNSLAEIRRTLDNLPFV